MLLYSLQAWLVAQYPNIEFYVSPSEAFRDGVLIEIASPEAFDIAANTYGYYWVEVRFFALYETKVSCISAFYPFYKNIREKTAFTLPANTVFEQVAKQTKILYNTVSEPYTDAVYAPDYQQYSSEFALRFGVAEG